MFVKVDFFKRSIRLVTATILLAIATLVVVPFQVPMASALPSGYREETIPSSTGKCNTKVEIPSVSSALGNLEVIEDGAFCVVIDKHPNANTNLAIRWVKPAGVSSIEYLVVGGGGAGGALSSSAGGGGAGGEVRTNPLNLLSVDAYSVLSFSVGKGGEYSCIRSGNNNETGTACVDPATNPKVIVRAAPGSNANTAANFGAGGGNSNSSGTNVAAPSIGFSGGSGNAVAGGGGSGACGPGGNATSSSGGSGGVGCPSTITGSLAYFGVGGGGGALCTGCSGGASPNGGGTGATSVTKVGSSPTAPNYGGGGGGNSKSSTVVPGGNGVVIIRYAIISPPAWTDDSISFGSACSRITNDGISASGTPAPQYELLSGSVLPPGLTFKSDGSGFNGTITAPGPYDFTIRAWNSAGSIQKRFTGTIQPCSNISVASVSYSNSTPVPGEEIEMEVVLANRAGPDDAPNTTFTYRVPDFVDAIPVGFTCSGTSTLICSGLGSLPISPQASNLDRRLKFKLTVRSSYSGGVTINGLCSVVSDAVDSDLSNNSTTCNFQPSAARADLRLASVALTGERTTYEQQQSGTRSFRISNLGPSDANNPSFVFTVNPSQIRPSGSAAEFSLPTTGSGTWSCSAPSGLNPTTRTCQSTSVMRSGSSIQVTIPTEAGIAPHGTQVDSTATVSSSTSDPVSANNTLTSMMMIVDLRPDFAVTARFDSGSVIPGTSTVFRVRVSNAGSVASNGPTSATFSLPNGLAVASGLDNSVRCNQGVSWTCQISSGLAVGESVEFSLNVAVEQDATAGSQLSITASTSAASTSDPNASGGESNLWNNSSVASLVVSAAESDLVLQVVRPDSTLAGTTASIVVSVTNSGPSSLSGYGLTYDLPLKVSSTGSLPAGCVLSPTGRRVTCSRASRFPRSALDQFTFTVLVDSSSVAGLTQYGSIDAATDVVDSNSTNNKATNIQANLNVVVPTVTPTSDSTTTTTTTTTSPPPTSSTIPRTGVAGQRNTQYGLGFLFAGLLMVQFARRRSIEKLR